jgi:hypothetical protein
MACNGLMPFCLIVWAQVLDGETLARIYLGEIRYWNDSAIAALNTGLNADGKLPGELIRLGAYSDGTLEVTQVRPDRNCLFLLVVF